MLNYADKILSLGQGIKCIFAGNQWLRPTYLEITLLFKAATPVNC